MSDSHDVARFIFVNKENELRSGWRVFVFFVCLFLFGALLTGLQNALAMLFPSLAFILGASFDSDSPSERIVRLCVISVTNIIVAAISCAVCARLLERRRFGSVGFKLHRGWRRDFGLGSLLGAASLAIAVGIGASVGSITFDVQTREATTLGVGFVTIVFIFIVAGAAEELAFRGFPLQALAHNQGSGTAIIITSLLFGVAHISNPGVSILSSINTVLAGMWLGVAYFLTRSLWLATGLHWSWNLAMVFIFGLPVSGLTELSKLSWLRGHAGEPSWVSGGNYGPEAGVAATVALLLSTLAIWKSGLFTPSEEMLASLKHGKPEPAVVSITPTKEQPAEPQEEALRDADAGGTTLD
jgi:hypothetical protein